MNTDTTPSEYLLLIRGTHWEKDLSPKEIQEFLNQWTAYLGSDDASASTRQEVR